MGRSRADLKKITKERSFIMAKGLLIASFNFSNVAEDEFHEWYDTEHIPERQRVPGFLNWQRWIGAKDPKLSVATYDLENIGVLRSAPYLAIGYENLSPWSKRVIRLAQRILRFEGEQIIPGDRVAPEGAGGLLVYALNVEPAFEAECNEWYAKEHIVNIAAVPGVLCARRFRATDSTHKYVAVYHLTSPDVVSSPAFKTAVETPWTHKVRPHMRDQLALLCRSYVRKA
jgi:hypothetical protein